MTAPPARPKQPRMYPNDQPVRNSHPLCHPVADDPSAVCVATGFRPELVIPEAVFLDLPACCTGVFAIPL